MSEDRPKYLYKYRAVANTEELENDLHLQALFACEAIFSSRTSFNDLFDSKIDFIRPTPKQIKTLMQKSDRSTAAYLQPFISKGKFTFQGQDRLMQATQLLNQLIDSYRFFCVSAKSTSNLMWSHYADCHKGFCIEFKSTHVPADKVIYKDRIPEIELIKMIGVFQPENSDIGEQIWKCLRTKLNEWNYEDEYRFQANRTMTQSMSPINAEIGKLTYPPDSVESIIFGCKMPERTKKFIRAQVPFNVKFKQAKELKNSIGIVDLG